MRRFKKPALQRQERQAEAPPTTGLMSEESVPVGRRPYGSANVVFGLPGRVVTGAGVFSQVINPDNKMGAVNEYDVFEDKSEHSAGSEDEESDASAKEAVRQENALRRAIKKEKQWKTWSEQIIPALLKPYVALLRETDSLRELDSARNHRGCSGCSLGRRLEVSCIFFESRLNCCHSSASSY